MGLLITDALGCHRMHWPVVVHAFMPRPAACPDSPADMFFVPMYLSYVVQSCALHDVKWCQFLHFSWDHRESAIFSLKYVDSTVQNEHDSTSQKFREEKIFDCVNLQSSVNLKRRIDTPHPQRIDTPPLTPNESTPPRNACKCRMTL